MAHHKLYFTLGILVAAIPFIGLPPQGETLLLVAIGFVLVILSIFGIIRRSKKVSVEIHTETFVENLEV